VAAFWSRIREREFTVPPILSLSSLS
jgi:hypothetical protein